MVSVETLDPLLKHLIEVESEMITLSGRAYGAIAGWIRETKLEASDEVLEAMQYQDILSQQLGATIEALEDIRELLSIESDGGDENSLRMQKIRLMDAKLVDILATAQQKRAAFSGKSDSDDDGIEFF